MTEDLHQDYRGPLAAAGLVSACLPKEVNDPVYLSQKITQQEWGNRLIWHFQWTSKLKKICGLHWKDGEDAITSHPLVGCGYNYRERTRSNTRYNIDSVLLRWYAHNIKLAIAKYTIQWRWIYPQGCATSTITFQNLFNTPKGNLSPFSSLPPPPPFSLPRPKQPPTCFLPLWVYLFWIFPVSGIPIHHLVFLASLTSRNVFEHNVAHHRFLSSYGWVIFHCVATLFN